eukprot:3704761-Amphidinium_carterae.1
MSLALMDLLRIYGSELLCTTTSALVAVPAAGAVPCMLPERRACEQLTPRSTPKRQCYHPAKDFEDFKAM